MNRLFDRIPEEIFSPLSRKYKAIYAFALVCLYQCLKSYKTDIHKTDYVNMLKNKGEELMALFSIETDKLDDRDDEAEVEIDKETENIINTKVNYIVNKLSKCGWFIIAKNSKTNAEYIYIPAYSINLLKVLNDLTSDLGAYLPIVHQTYAELKMEDEKEDDYMYRSLLNARLNADKIEMSVTLLKQQICVFGNRLTYVLDPNDALRQHFDDYRVNVADKYYHPMKTFDSLGLYAQPTINILKKWMKSERIISTLVKEARLEPDNLELNSGEITKKVIKLIQEIIDIFSRLSSSFDEIDAANATYTEAVQRKVNYLSSSDKTVKGKIDKIILMMANEIKNNPALSYDEMPMLQNARETINAHRVNFIDSHSLSMPFKRTFAEDTLPLPLDDFDFTLDSEMFNQKLDNDLSLYSDQAILAFIEEKMDDKTELLSTDIEINDTRDLVLLILATIKAMLHVIPYDAIKLEDRVEHSNYYMPLYKFIKKNK